MNKIDLRKRTSIDDDYALWAAEQAARIRGGKFDRAELENIAGELDFLGKHPAQPEPQGPSGGRHR